jgi:hypothetical protein
MAYVANSSDPAAAALKVPTASLLEALLDDNVTQILLLTNYSVRKYALQLPLDGTVLLHCCTAHS